jgi:Flp pilus assembly protein TadD
MASVLMKQDQLDSALTALKDATGREPGNAVAWNNLGVLYERRGQINDAIASYKAAIKANPSDADAKANLARFGKSTTGTTKP